MIELLRSAVLMAKVAQLEKLHENRSCCSDGKERFR